MGGAENAKDLLSSNYCFKDVVVGMSSSESKSYREYLKAGCKVGKVIIRSSCDRTSLL